MYQLAPIILTIGTFHALITPAISLNRYIFAALIASMSIYWIGFDAASKLIVPSYASALVLAESFGFPVRTGMRFIPAMLLGIIPLLVLNDWAFSILLAFLAFSPLSPLSLKLQSLLIPCASPVLTGSFQTYYQSNPLRKDNHIPSEADGKRGIFGLSHVLLNLDANTSQWGNLGYWRPNPTLDPLLALYPHALKTHYTTAASRLATAVYHAAGLYTAPAPVRVLDIGFGSGDQLFMLAAQIGHLAAAQAGASAGQETKDNDSSSGVGGLGGPENAADVGISASSRSSEDGDAGDGDHARTEGLPAQGAEKPPQYDAKAVASVSSLAVAESMLVGVNLCADQVSAANARAPLLLPPASTCLPASPTHAHTTPVSFLSPPTSSSSSSSTSSPPQSAPSTRLAFSARLPHTPPASAATPSPHTHAQTYPQPLHVHMCQGSATALSAALCAHHLPPRGYTHATCIDTAYHFQLRCDFLTDVFARLAAGGVLAYTDVVLGDAVSARAHRITKMLCGLCSIPSANMKTRAEHVREVKAAGFTDVSVIALDAELQGFSDFMMRYMSVWGGTVVSYQWYKFVVTARALKMALEAGYISYILVTANKPV